MAKLQVSAQTGGAGLLGGMLLFAEAPPPFWGQGISLDSAKGAALTRLLGAFSARQPRLCCSPHLDTIPWVVAQPQTWEELHPALGGLLPVCTRPVAGSPGIL